MTVRWKDGRRLVETIGAADLNDEAGCGADESGAASRCEVVGWPAAPDPGEVLRAVAMRIPVTGITLVSEAVLMEPRQARAALEATPVKTDRPDAQAAGLRVWRAPNGTSWRRSRPTGRPGGTIAPHKNP